MKPDEDGGEVQKGHEVASELVEAHGDPTEALDALEEVFDQVPLLVEVAVDESTTLTGRPAGSVAVIGGDHGGAAVGLQQRDQVLGVVGPVTTDVGVGDKSEQLWSKLDLVLLPLREQQADRVSQGINERVDFRGRTQPRVADLLRPPFLPRLGRPDGRAQSWRR